jgi:hypothetical protein
MPAAAILGLVSGALSPLLGHGLLAILAPRSARMMCSKVGPVGRGRPKICGIATASPLGSFSLPPPQNFPAASLSRSQGISKSLFKNAYSR